jgi:hypothetical protein
MPGGWLPNCSECPNLVETYLYVSGLNNPDAALRKALLFVHPILLLTMFIFMLGLLLATAILALKTVSNIQEMLVPEPVRVK